MSLSFLTFSFSLSSNTSLSHNHVQLPVPAGKIGASERLELWNPLFAGFEHPSSTPICDKKALCSASTLALSWVPNASAPF